MLKETNAGYKQFREVCIDIPSLFQILVSKLCFIGGFTSTFFAKDEIQFERIQILACGFIKNQAESNKTKANIKNNTNINTPLSGERTL